MKSSDEEGIAFKMKVPSVLVLLRLRSLRLLSKGTRLAAGHDVVARIVGGGDAPQLSKSWRRGGDDRLEDSLLSLWRRS
jgi:hypothetical protein